MICHKCGMNLDRDSKFCSYCGAEITPQSSINSDDSIKSSDNHSTFARAKKLAPLKVLVIGAVGVFVVALIAFMVGDNSKGGSSDIGEELYDAGFVESKSDGIYQYDVYSNHIVITDIYGDWSDRQLIIPSEIEGKSVTEIECDSFGLSCYNVSHLEIPSSITSIGYNAFYQDSKLEVVVGGDGLKKLGAGVFYGTPWLNEQSDEFVTIGDGILLKYNGSDQDIRIPDGIKFIADFAFEGYDHNIVSVSFPPSVKKIGDYAFTNMKALEQVDFSKGLVEIGDAAFFACEMLHDIELPDTFESIGVSAFEQCTSLMNITIPGSTKEIGESAFKGTPYFDSARDEFVIVGDGILIKYNGGSSYVDIPDGVKIIVGAFAGNEALQGVTIPDSTTRIGRFAFSGCKLLQSVTLPEDLLEIGYGAFRACSELTTITLPEGLQVIDGYAFSFCTKLKIILPESLSYIGNAAFSNCDSITRIAIPPNVHRLRKNTFEFCDSLAVVCLTNAIRDIEYHAFYATSGIVICCEKDSYAYHYAKANEFDDEIEIAEKQEDGTSKAVVKGEFEIF